MPDLLYIVGQPGSGKSTLAAALTGGLDAEEYEQPFAHRLYPAAQLVELGARREGFAGTDALPMNVQPKVVEWLAKAAVPYVLAEGDRLANSKFFNSVLACGWQLRIAYLAIPASVAEERRTARAAELGVGPQDPKWIKGRQTKTRRLVEEWGAMVYRLNGTRPTVELMGDLIRTGDSVVSTLIAARPPR
jgi:GTPase SAR1 family protein